MRILGTEQQAAKDLAARFSREHLTPNAAELDMSEHGAAELLSKMGDVGFLGMGVPPAYGGSTSDALSLVLALEELSKGSASMALCCLAHLAACRAITEGGSDLLKESLLPQLAQGTKLAALTVHEAGCGAVSALIETEATRQEDSCVVNGSKIFATNAAHADYFVTLVRTDLAKGSSGTSFLVIEKGTDGFSLGGHHRRMGLNGTGSRELFFDACRVPTGCLLGKEGAGLELLSTVVREVGMPGMAAIALGTSEAALDAALHHARQRTIGREVLGTRAAIRDMVAEMSTLVSAVKASVYSAATSTETISRFQAKLFATETALRVTDLALQVHGGHGYSSEFPVERYYRDARGLKLHFMTSELLRETIAKHVLAI
ncbi:MAG: acyl-CoA dehydrogenase family protein [Bacillota bacterium]